jgi:hypothetical protein
VEGEIEREERAGAGGEWEERRIEKGMREGGSYVHRL